MCITEDLGKAPAELFKEAQRMLGGGGYAYAKEGQGARGWQLAPGWAMGPVSKSVQSAAKALWRSGRDLWK